jgi:hypothetical protein
MPKLNNPKEVLVKDNNDHATYRGVIVFREDGVFPHALIYIPNTAVSLGMLAICELYAFDSGVAVWQLVASASTIDLRYKQEKYIQNLLINIDEEAQNE